MKFSLAICCMTITAMSLAVQARAQDQPSMQARVAARHELEMAKIELRNYWQIEYPRQRRALNAAIELTEAEIKVYEERLNAYRPFTRFTIGEPLLVTIQDLQMCLKESELRLKDLQAERANLIRFHGDDFRALEIRVQQARLRVAELEANDVVVAQPPAKP